jgi:hypothetical protein
VTTQRSEGLIGTTTKRACDDVGKASVVVIHVIQLEDTGACFVQGTHTCDLAIYLTGESRIDFNGAATSIQLHTAIGVKGHRSGGLESATVEAQV